MAYSCDICGLLVCEHSEPCMAVDARVRRVVKAVNRAFSDLEGEVLLICEDCEKFFMLEKADIEEYFDLG